MTTLATLITEVSSDLRDPSNLTFTTGQVTDFINEAISEVSRISPAYIRADIAFVANTLSYTVSGGFRETEVYRVEVWDKTQTPEAYIGTLQPAAGERFNASATGWEVRNGTLYITNAQAAAMTAGTHTLRVWGYEPFAQLVTGGTVSLSFSAEQEWGIREYARILGLTALINTRELFSQWQTASHNTDVSLAGLVGVLNNVNDSWRRRSNRLLVLRETP